MANYSTPLTVANLNLEDTAGYNLIEKVAKQIIRGVTADNKLEDFNRGVIENGALVEDVVFGLVEGSNLVDTVPGTPFSAPEATPMVRYFKNWNQVQYATGLTLRKLRKYLNEGKSVEDIAGIVAGQLAQSAAQADYEAIRDMFADAVDLGAVDVTNDVIGKNAATTFHEVVKALKNTITGMTFVNDTFNSANIKRRTLKDDIRIVMPYQLYNAIEVDLLSGLFNLSKVEIQERILLVDGNLGNTETGGYNIVVTDKNAVQIWTRLYEMTSAYDGQQLRTNYFLTTDKLYGLSPLYDCAVIKYQPAN